MRTTTKKPCAAASVRYPHSILEEELKNRVAADWFNAFDCSRILGKVDFCAAAPATELPLCDAESVVWAEAKRGADAPLDFALVQLILTIGKERTFDRHLPPKFLAAFNAARIAFIPYSEVVEIFYQNDFNWNVAPSDHETREFGKLYQRVISILESATLEFDFAKDEAELRRFIKTNLNTEVDWLNDRDQFLYPTDGWKADAEFQSDCLVFTLFHGQNRISSRDGINHWIPFTEQEVGAKDCFASHFMSDWLAGRGTARSVIAPYQGELDFSGATGTRDESPMSPMSPLSQMSQQARAVLDAGRELWRYYHAQPNANPNASYYDIRLHFQGTTTDAKGKVKMNSDSADATYATLIADLRAAMKSLAKRIEPKVYEYGFLKR